MASILIVDDDKAVQIITRLMLEREGHHVTCANDGPRALEILNEARFDLLIIDIFMPEMDGLETMRLVHRRHPGVPVIVISGHALPAGGATTPDFLAMSTKLGALTTLQKPFKSAVLLMQVERCLQGAPLH
jgi:two-component system response regulator (stage 0 sporulation protein F)